MASNDAQVLRTLNRSIDTHQAQMQLLMGVAYREGDEAFKAWGKYYERHGFDKAVSKFFDKPQAFGKLKGQLMFGFWKTEDRKNADIACREFRQQAKRSHVAQLQKQELQRQQQVQKHRHQQQGEQAIKATQKSTSKQTKKTLSQRF